MWYLCSKLHFYFKLYSELKLDWWFWKQFVFKKERTRILSFHSLSSTERLRHVVNTIWYNRSIFRMIVHINCCYRTLQSGSHIYLTIHAYKIYFALQKINSFWTKYLEKRRPLSDDAPSNSSQLWTVTLLHTSVQGKQKINLCKIFLKIYSL